MGTATGNVGARATHISASRRYLKPKQRRGQGVIAVITVSEFSLSPSVRYPPSTPNMDEEI
jgi:hypothetical protein